MLEIVPSPVIETNNEFFFGTGQLRANDPLRSAGSEVKSSQACCRIPHRRTLFGRPNGSAAHRHTPSNICQLRMRSGTARPVISITGHGDVDMAVGAIQNGAFDFIEKPFDEARLLASIRDGTERAELSKSTAVQVDELQARFDSLSAHQREVMELVITELSSKEIGRKLNISPKTVENHRA